MRHENRQQMLRDLLPVVDRLVVAIEEVRPVANQVLLGRILDNLMAPALVEKDSNQRPFEISLI